MSWLVRKDPFSEFRNVQDELSTFLKSALRNDEGLVGNWNPRVDIAETADSIVLEADLPGMKPGDFELSVENFTLTLKGSRNFEKKTEGENYHRVERSYGSFSRTFSLPSTVDLETVNAEFNDGVLKVTLQKREEVKPRQIKVSVKTDAGEAKSKTADVK